MSALDNPHIAPLTEFVHSIRVERGLPDAIPYFDPLDGGLEAKALFLLEAPGSKAVRSGFVSRNNPDPTARNMCLLLRQAAIPREDTILWNVIPWYLGNQVRIRPAGSTDIVEGAEYLGKLLQLLPRLAVVVLVGKAAQRARPFVEERSAARILETHHPSARVFNIWPDKRKQVLAVLQDVAVRIKN
ncbi:MAG: uracil-DNA glycosylase [candidate division NC10 bacterium]|nr:uracil-DNA glycosylase [candidate division NC10 bacterium]